MNRNLNVSVNIAADGLATAVIKSVTDSEEVYRKNTQVYLAEYLKNTKVGRLLFNVCYKRSVTDSDTMDSVLYNVETDELGFAVKGEDGMVIKHPIPECTTNTLFKGYRELAEREIDIIAMAVEETHRYGAEAWLSVRMNDHHFAQDPLFNSTLSYEHPDKYGVDGSRQCLDFSTKTVQNYYREYIRELCTKYDIDGIELDFLRSCPIMTEVNQENMQDLSAYVAELKEMVSTAGAKPIGLSARVYSVEEENLGYGIDAAQWVADGSIEMLVPEGWYIPTYFSIPVEKWRESIAAKNTKNHSYTLLPGTDWGVLCDIRDREGYRMWLTLEQFKGFASSAYQRGADGVYLFNHFAPWSEHGAWTWYMDDQGRLHVKNIFREKLEAADSREASEKGMRTYVHTCRNFKCSIYPAPVSDEKSCEIEVNTGSAPAAGTYEILIGIDRKEGWDEDLLTVELNGAKTLQIQDVKAPVGFEWKVSEENSPYADHVSEVAPRVMRFVPEDLKYVKDGNNQICIRGTKKEQSVKWIEVCVEAE